MFNYIHDISFYNLDQYKEFIEELSKDCKTNNKNIFQTTFSNIDTLPQKIQINKYLPNILNNLRKNNKNDYNAMIYNKF